VIAFFSKSRICLKKKFFTEILSFEVIRLRMVEISKKYRIEMPISHSVHDILFKEKDPKTTIHELMSRELIEE